MRLQVEVRRRAVPSLARERRAQLTLYGALYGAPAPAPPNENYMRVGTRLEVRARRVSLPTSRLARAELLALYLASRPVPETAGVLLYRPSEYAHLRLPPPHHPRPLPPKKRALQFAAPQLAEIVPAITGLSLGTALATLASHDLIADESFQQSLTIPADVIISQNPSSGTRVAPGSAVAIVISLGASFVPQVVNTMVDAAIAAIAAAGLVPSITTLPTNTATPGLVLSQNPVAGTPLLAGQTVFITVATLPGPTPGKLLTPSTPVPSAHATTLADIASADWSLMLDDTAKGVAAAGIGQVVQGVDDIVQCIEIILSTPLGSDPLRPTFGLDQGLYIDVPLQQLAPALVGAGKQAIETWEPRVLIESMSVAQNEPGHLTVTIQWRMVEGPSTSFTSTVVL